MLLLVAVGAAAGGVVRYCLATASGRVACSAVPGTFTANVAACAVAGFAWSMWGDGTLQWAAAGAGFAGALSTWSTLARETVELARNRSWWAAGYPVSSVLAGAAAAGIFLA